jgi:hypothetical protein
VDNDDDGYNNPASSGCPHPELDCNDNEPNVNPGVLEGPYWGPVCSDGIDNNCDGKIDLNDPGCVPSFSLPSVPVSQGDFLYFVVDPNGDFSCDSTALDVTIQSGATWNLGSDFRLSPGQANPNPDSYGNSEVWYFMESATFVRDPSTYTMLPNFITDAFLIEGLETWQGTETSGGPHDKLPAVGINSTGLAQHLGSSTFSWHPGDIRVHPSDKLAVVGWRSPIDGEVRVRGSIAAMDTGCGNGIAWFVDNDAGTLAQGQTQ